MNSMERVLNSFQGKPVDRRAISLTLSLYGARLTRCPLKEYYSNPEEYRQGQLAAVEKCRSDILFSPFILTSEAEAFGCEITSIPKNPPNQKKPVIRNPGEIGKLNMPDIDSHRSLLYTREALRLLAKDFKGVKPIAGIAMSPVDLPALLMGIEGWLDLLLFHEKETHQILEITVSFFIRWVNALFDDGADFAVLPSMFSNPRLITGKIVSHSIIPILTEAFKQVKGPLVFHHGGNKIGDFMNLYKDLPNVGAFVLDPKDKFDQVRESIGSDRLLMGNINGPNLWRFKPEQVRNLCTGILENRRDDTSFIFATSCADIAYDTPLENITAMVETVQNYK